LFVRLHIWSQFRFLISSFSFNLSLPLPLSLSLSPSLSLSLSLSLSSPQALSADFMPCVPQTTKGTAPVPAIHIFFNKMYYLHCRPSPFLLSHPILSYPFLPLLSLSYSFRLSLSFYPSPSIPPLSLSHVPFRPLLTPSLPASHSLYLFPSPSLLLSPFLYLFLSTEV
jgi:hypothetical protein